MPETNAESEGHGVTGLACLLTTGGLIGVGRSAHGCLRLGPWWGGAVLKCQTWELRLEVFAKLPGEDLGILLPPHPPPWRFQEWAASINASRKFLRRHRAQTDFLPSGVLL